MTHTYRNHKIVPGSEVEPYRPGRGRWAIDVRDEDSTCAEYIYGYVTLADARKGIDEILDGLCNIRN
jgi:hypothetical protein